MAGKLEGKVAIVTGAAHGMGASHALVLARNGADVAVTDIARNILEAPVTQGTEEEARNVVEQIKAMGRRSIFVQCDVSKASEVSAMVKRVIDEFGRIDILVNNAGFVKRVPAEELSEADWDRQVDVIMKGTFLCSQAVGRHMIKQKYGKIINIASTCGYRGFIGRTAYCAAKAGVINMTRQMAV